MADRIWKETRPVPGQTIEAFGLNIRVGIEAGASLISGDLAKALQTLAPDAPMLGLLDVIPVGPHAIRIGRDRALLRTEFPLAMNGWRDGFAISAADDLYVPIEVIGARADLVLSACLAVSRKSPSASTLFAGREALVSGQPDGFVVRATQPEIPALWSHLAALTQVL